MASRSMNLRWMIGCAAIAWLALSTLSPADDERPPPQRRADPPTSTGDKERDRHYAGGSAGQERDDNGLQMKLRWCPPGLFTMEKWSRTVTQLNLRPAAEKPDNDDVPVDESADEFVIGEVVEADPIEVVLTRGFWIGKYEVTRTEWQRIMGTEPWANRKVVVEGGDLPATYVSWNDATEFCRKFTAEERNAGRLPAGWEYTLPTEAQWERACRADVQTAFSFGDDESMLGKYAWIRTNTQDRNEPYPHRVGQKRPNSWGLHDMHGNVVEWCRDWWGALPGGTDPEIAELKPNLRSEKVQRGGDWSQLGSACRTSARNMARPDVRNLGFGFRLALSSVR
jgi:formylglycine-generating enzyme required for sulfatase activity